MQENILDKTESILKERAEQYGDAKESFERIAKLWQAYLGTEVYPRDVINMMILLKVSRTLGTGTIDSAEGLDSYVDICGYAALVDKL